MKTLIKFLSIGLFYLAIISLTSCSEKVVEIGTGTAEFSLSTQDEANLSKSDVSDNTEGILSYQIMISVEDMSGGAVFTDTVIPLYVFGTGFISENIKIKTGEYKLTKFLVINPAGEVVFATPLAGSPLAYLVNRPLPFSFRINADQVTKIIPEVLPVGEYPPEQFGYAAFGIQIIKPLDFWTICYVDNPIIMPPVMPVTAKLTVYKPDGWHYSFRLEAKVNHLVIRGGSDIYYFLLEKEGFIPQKFQFTASQLLATGENNPLILKFPWEAQFKLLVLQPGPENGKDAMISNLEPDKNFGDHKYFEATYLSEPVLTVMRSNRSLIWFDMNSLPKSAIIKKVVLQLYYDIPIPFDNAYITTPEPSTGVAWYGGVLQKIIEPWDEYKVTWNSQPKTTESGQVYIPPFIRNVNFIDVDVTRLFVPVNDTSTPNYGMFFRLWPADRFPGFRFASGDFPDASMRPKLKIYYTLPL